MWNVSESTVKRWADAGDLRCVKTVGGHRRFRLEDISRFQSSHGFEAVGALALVDSATEDPLEHALERRDFEALAALFLRFAVDGQSDPLGNLLGRAYLRGVAPVELHDRIVAPALRRVGELWRSGEI